MNRPDAAPPRDCRCDVDGLQLAGLAWEHEGGIPVLALHGWMDHAASFQELASRLAGCHVVALNLSGQGRSGHRSPHATYNIWDNLPQIAGVLDQLGWKGCALLGHSRGVNIATFFAVAQPERARADGARQTVTLPSGQTVGYVEMGKTEVDPLILIHGYTDNSRSWSLLEVAGRHILAVDLRGHGGSSAPGCCYTVMDFSHDLDGFMAEKGIGKADTRSTPTAASCWVCWRSPQLPAPLSTARTCSRSPGRSSTGSTSKAARFWRPFPRRTATIPSLPGPRVRSGWASIAGAASIRSIPRPVLRRIESDHFVTGVTWVEGALWHGTWQDEQSDIRRLDPATGAVLEWLEMPPSTGVSGLESDGGERFFCGGGGSGRLRVVLRKADPAVM